MAFRPMNQRFKRGLGGSGGSPQTTTTPAGHPQHSNNGTGPRRPAGHGLVGVREQRRLIVKAIATRSDCEGVPSANRGATAGPLHAYAPAREFASTADAAVPSTVGEHTYRAVVWGILGKGDGVSKLENGSFSR
jgi:hypothetical protein